MDEVAGAALAVPEEDTVLVVDVPVVDALVKLALTTEVDVVVVVVGVEVEVVKVELLETLAVMNTVDDASWSMATTDMNVISPSPSRLLFPTLVICSVCCWDGSTSKEKIVVGSASALLRSVLSVPETN